MNSTVLTQPGNSQNGPVTVRNLQDTPEDTDFAGRLTVEGFRDKYEHATSKNSIGKCHIAMAKEHRNQSNSFYERIFVAEVDGKRAGLMVLKFHGDPNVKMDDANFSDFGCCESMGLQCYLQTVNNEPVASGQGYLDHICVEEEFRGRGIGKVLLEAADQEARRLNCREIYLWVATTNRAKNLYERHGYECVEDSGCCLCCLLWCILGKTFKSTCYLLTSSPITQNNAEHAYMSEISRRSRYAVKFKSVRSMLLAKSAVLLIFAVVAVPSDLIPWFMRRFAKMVKQL